MFFVYKVCNIYIIQILIQIQNIHKHTEIQNKHKQNNDVVKNHQKQKEEKKGETSRAPHKTKRPYHDRTKPVP